MKFDSIQTLRAIAVMMVVFYHSHWAAQGKHTDFFQVPLLSDFGYLGVQLFFCISGFIMAHVATKDDFAPKSFLRRRFWRIVPLYWVTLLLIMLISFTSNIFDKQVETLGVWGIAKSFLMLPMQEYPLLSPGWSLEHEVIFYIIVALVVPFAGLRVLFLTIFALWVIGLNYYGWDYHLFSKNHIYFALGIAAYWLRKKNPVLLGLGSALGLIAGYLSLYGFFQFSSAAKSLSLAIGFSFLISTLVSLEYRGTRFPQLFVRIGNISYSLYLVHVFVYIGFEKVAWKINANPEAWRLLGLIAAIIIANLTYKYLETPLHKTGNAFNLKPKSKKEGE